MCLRVSQHGRRFVASYGVVLQHRCFEVVPGRDGTHSELKVT